jgi:hypothetical protein
VGVSAALGMGGALSSDGIPDALGRVGGMTLKGKRKRERGAVILKDRDDDIGKHGWAML